MSPFAKTRQESERGRMGHTKAMTASGDDLNWVSVGISKDGAEVLPVEMSRGRVPRRALTGRFTFKGHRHWLCRHAVSGLPNAREGKIVARSLLALILSERTVHGAIRGRRTLLADLACSPIRKYRRRKNGHHCRRSIPKHQELKLIRREQ